MDRETFINNYFKRISYSGDRAHNLKNLSNLQRAHSKAIPFENTYVLKKIPIYITREWIYDKIVNLGRGGFCFEVNYLFYLLLFDLGYNVKLLGGSVFQPGTGKPGHTNEHILPLVTLDEKCYVLDVAFGAKCSLEPLILTFDEELHDPNGIFRYRKENDHIRFECRPKTVIDIDTNVEVQSASDTWIGLYQFNSNPIEICDTETAFEFHTTSPTSVFARGFYISRFTDIGKTTFSGNILTIYTSNGNMVEKSKRIEVPQSEYDKELARHFGLKEIE